MNNQQQKNRKLCGALKKKRQKEEIGGIKQTYTIVRVSMETLFGCALFWYVQCMLRFGCVLFWYVHACSVLVAFYFGM